VERHLKDEMPMVRERWGTDERVVGQGTEALGETNPTPVTRNKMENRLAMKSKGVAEGTAELQQRNQFREQKTRRKEPKKKG